MLSTEYPLDMTDKTDLPLKMVFIGWSVSRPLSRDGQLKCLAGDGAAITGVRGAAVQKMTTRSPSGCKRVRVLKTMRIEEGSS